VRAPPRDGGRPAEVGVLLDLPKPAGSRWMEFKGRNGQVRPGEVFSTTRQSAWRC
jgi:hypothetical protein